MRKNYSTYRDAMIATIRNDIIIKRKQKLLSTDYNLIKHKFKSFYFNDVELYDMSAFINKLLVLEGKARSSA